MQKFRYILYSFVILASCLACQRDENIYDSDFVEEISLHLTYKDLGTRLNYSSPPVVKMVNMTEQLISTFQADEKGNVVLSGLLPGHYSMNVTARLSEEEMRAVTGDPEARAGTMGGSLNNLKLNLGEQYDLEGLELMISSSNPVILKELYYCGSKTPTGGNYRNDSFYTIYNNSIEDVSLEDYYLVASENFGGFGAGPLWPGEEVGQYKHIYAATVWKISAGNHKDILRSGEEAVIAVMAAPHNQNPEFNLSSPVDLSSARFEAYCPDPENPHADFTAQNMELTFWPDYGYLWRISVFGQAISLVKATKEEMAGFEEVMLPESFRDPFESDEYWICKKIPVKYVVDAVDLLQNRTSTETKRFPSSLDAGGATVEDTYCGKSVIRKVQSVNGDLTVYQDTNNSTEDFIINPSPLK